MTMNNSGHVYSTSITCNAFHFFRMSYKDQTFSLGHILGKKKGWLYRPCEATYWGGGVNFLFQIITHPLPPSVSGLYKLCETGLVQSARLLGKMRMRNYVVMTLLIKVNDCGLNLTRVGIFLFLKKICFSNRLLAERTPRNKHIISTYRNSFLQ